MRIPVIRLSDSARQALREAAVDAGGDLLRMQISDRFEYDLIFGSRAEGDLDVDCGGITILLDPSSAPRADGLSIDFVSGPDGAGFTIENPNEPPRVRQMSATELKAMIDRGLSFELVDVRTEDERAIAKIEGSRLLNEEGHNYLLSLDRNTTIVFHCHHGIRSQSAAEYFLGEKSFRWIISGFGSRELAGLPLRCGCGDRRGRCRAATSLDARAGGLAGVPAGRARSARSRGGEPVRASSAT